MRIQKEKSNYDYEFLKLLKLSNKKYTSDFLVKRLKNMLINDSIYDVTLCNEVKNLLIKKRTFLYNKDIVDIGNNLLNNLVNNSYTDNNFYSNESDVNYTFSYTSVNDYSQNVIETIDLSDNYINLSNNIDLSFNEIVTDNDIINELFSFMSNKNMISSATLYNIIREFKVLNYSLDNEGYQVKTITI